MILGHYLGQILQIANNDVQLQMEGLVLGGMKNGQDQSWPEEHTRTMQQPLLELQKQRSYYCVHRQWNYCVHRQWNNVE